MTHVRQSIRDNVVTAVTGLSTTKYFHFSVIFDPHTGHPVEFFITGRGKVGQRLDTELYELSVKASKLMQGEIEDDLPRMPEGGGASASEVLRDGGLV